MHTLKGTCKKKYIILLYNNPNYKQTIENGEIEERSESFLEDTMLHNYLKGIVVKFRLLKWQLFH